MFLLKSNRLRVEISEPGECPNNNFRFDRAGFISEVVLDGDRHFCANEPKNLAHPSTGGRGLCCEYTADYSGEVNDGEYYPKFGIGLIKKDGPYCFYTRYPDVKEFPVSFSHDETSAEFVTDPIVCLGYGLKSRKKISAEENRLTVEVVLENVGEKEIVTEEYCHNFLSIDGMAVSPDYRLDLPTVAGLGGREIPNQYPGPCNFLADGNGIALKRCETAVSLSSIPLDGMEETGEFVWRLIHKGAKAMVVGRDFITPSKLTLWSADHIISPEIFHTVSVKPGGSVSWKRCMAFESVVQK